MFLTSEDLASYKLALTQKDPENKMMVWTNIQPTAKINRVVDIRWVFASEEEALTFHKHDLIINSEKMKEGALGNQSPLGKEFHLFISDSGDKLLAGLGLNMAMYNFLFVEDIIVVKVFVSGSGSLKLSEALDIAKKADERIKKSFKQSAKGVSAQDIAEAMVQNMKANMEDPNFESENERINEESARKAFGNNKEKLEKAGSIQKREK